MGAACCAGAALAGGGGASISSAAADGSLLALPLALYEVAPRATLLVSTGLVLLASLAYLFLLVLTPVSRPATAKELRYLSPSDDPAASAAERTEDHPLPSIREAASVQLSVVIPAYNERERLPGMLRDSLAWLEQARKEQRSLVSLPSAAAASSSSSEKQPDASKDANANRRASPLPPGKDQDTEVEGSGTLEDGDGGCAAERGALTRPLQTYEVLVVDDGSSDGTAQVALDTAREMDLAPGAEVRVVRLERNRGKGGAVRHGVLHTRGALILFADADGATRFSDLSALCLALARILTPRGHGLVVGSRAHLVTSDAVVRRSFIRNLLMHLFHLLLTLLLHPPSFPSLPAFLSAPFAFAFAVAPPRQRVERLPRQPQVRDTQCGFKLFARTSAALLFPLAHIDRWIFDVELLVLAELACRASLQNGSVWSHRRALALGHGAASSCRSDAPGSESESEANAQEDGRTDPLMDLAVPVAEVPVHWHEVGGSKIDLVKDSIGMAVDLLVIRANYALGRWEAPGKVAL